jgi:hypothetical protein
MENQNVREDSILRAGDKMRKDPIRKAETRPVIEQVPPSAPATTLPKVEPVTNFNAETKRVRPSKSSSKTNTPKLKRGRPFKNTDDHTTTLSMVSKKHLLHESEVLEISKKSSDKSVLERLLFQIMLYGVNIHEDHAPKVLAYLWHHAQTLDGRKCYIKPLKHLSKALELSYPTTQNIVKKLVDESLLERVEDGLAFSSLLVNFIESTKHNKQLVFTLEEKEEQLETIDEDGHINEEMASK